MHHKNRTHTHLALNFDPSTVPVDNLFTDRKSQARAGYLAFIFAHTIKLGE